MLDASSNHEYNLVIEVMIIMGKDEKIVNDDDHPIQEVFKDVDHGLMKAETSNENAFLHER